MDDYDADIAAQKLVVEWARMRQPPPAFEDKLALHAYVQRALQEAYAAGAAGERYDILAAAECAHLDDGLRGKAKLAAVIDAIHARDGEGAAATREVGE